MTFYRTSRFYGFFDFIGLCYYRGDVLELSLVSRIVRQKLYILYILNVADWICTVLLLRAGGFIEANPLTRVFIDSIPMGLLIKVALPAAAVAVILRLIKELDKWGITAVNRFTTLVLAFYIALCVNHIVNFMLLFFG